MPYIIRPKGARKFAAALFGTVLLIGAVPAAANAACPSNPSSALLAQYGDNAAYSLLPGSSFESGAPGWSLSNAEVVEGSGVDGSSNALAIEPGGVAVSPAFCVSSEDPSFRFFVRQVSGGGVLNVRLRWMNPRHRWFTSNDIPVGSLQGETSWALSPTLELARKLSLWMPGSTANVELVFESSKARFEPGPGGAWEIDGVYIDPYSR
jgi:hypothetical protein